MVIYQDPSFCIVWNWSKSLCWLWWWVCKPILVFSLTFDKAEQKCKKWESQQGFPVSFSGNIDKKMFSFDSRKPKNSRFFCVKVFFKRSFYMVSSLPLNYIITRNLRMLRSHRWLYHRLLEITFRLLKDKWALKYYKSRFCSNADPPPLPA